MHPAVDFALFPGSFSCCGSLSTCSLWPFTVNSPYHMQYGSPVYTARLAIADVATTHTLTDLLCLPRKVGGVRGGASISSAPVLNTQILFSDQFKCLNRLAVICGLCETT